MKITELTKILEFFNASTLKNGEFNLLQLNLQYVAQRVVKNARSTVLRIAQTNLKLLHRKYLLSLHVRKQQGSDL